MDCHIQSVILCLPLKTLKIPHIINRLPLSQAVSAGKMNGRLGDGVGVNRTTEILTKQSSWHDLTTSV